MSVLRPLLSRRGRLVLAAVALLLMSALVLAPSVSGARGAVKQFLATITPTTGTSGVSGTWTETVTNCGFPVVSPCTSASTIGLGSIRIAVPTEFQSVTVSITDKPTGKNWTASFDSATATITAVAVTGNDKLGPGQSVSIAISATPTTTSCPATPFTTAAWGSASVPGTEPFQIKTAQPSVTVGAPGEACLGSGGTVTDPVSGQTETISGDFQGHVNITFDGTLIDCGFDSQFGNQWSDFHLPAQVNIIPASDFVAGNSPKISTSTFTPVVPGDSSSYLICWAALDPFTTRSGESDVVNIGGTDFFVGILPNCYNPVTGNTRPEPCVSEQFLDLTTNKIVISVRTPPGDPHKR
jgi:hypothetical protein